MRTIGSTVRQYSRLECGLCKYHFKRMFKSGRNPIYHHFCEHPGIDEKSVKQSKGLETINDLSSDRFIGETDITPDWCPISRTKG